MKLAFLFLIVSQVGDQIIEINGHSTKNMTHAEAIELIQNGSSCIRLLIKRTSTVRQSGSQTSAWPRCNISYICSLYVVYGIA